MKLKNYKKFILTFDNPNVIENMKCGLDLTKTKTDIYDIEENLRYIQDRDKGFN